VTLLPVFFAIAYLAGMRMRIFGMMFLCLLLAAPVAWKFALKDYQKSRVSTFLDPSQDAKGAGYSRSRRASPSARGASPAKASRRGRRGNCGSCRSP
jgi:rod shape determining protein RodA